MRKRYQGQLRLDFAGIAELRNRFSNFDEKALEFANAVMAEEESEVLTALRFVPGTPVGPFQWSVNSAANRRAMRWWFWAVKAGVVETDGHHYIRSGRIAAAWQLFVTWRANRLTLTAKNNAVKGIVVAYIYGSLSFRSDEEARRYQIPGHQRTGWPLAKPIIARFFKRFEDAWLEQLAYYVGARLKPTRSRRSRR